MVTVVPTSRLQVSPPKVEPPEPCMIIIFGSRGDLAQRKLWPALYNLDADGLLPDQCVLLGLGRRPIEQESFIQAVRQDVEAHRTQPMDPAVWERFARRLVYFQGAFDDAESFNALLKEVQALEGRHGTLGNRVFYLAVPPSVVSDLLAHLHRVRLVYPRRHRAWSRVVFEKPFGHDLDSAHDLNRQVAAYLHESQVYRIDHYLAKETVQNILVFRFGNSLFESVWTRHYIDHVQITMAEEIGIGNRGAFYEEAGVVRDVVQNHLLELLSLVAMEPPTSFDAEDIRDEKVKVYRSIKPMTPEQVRLNTVRGQYAGYRGEPNVAADSHTPTFTALRLFVDNWRWKGVPFYIRAGKRLRERRTEIIVRFRETPVCLFCHEDDCRQLAGNELSLQIQPREAINLSFMVKPPGPRMSAQSVEMRFCYETEYGYHHDAYERLLLNSLQGDPTLFVRSDAVEAQWQIITPILNAWESDTVKCPVYPPGTWGPPDADILLARDERKWRYPFGDEMWTAGLW
ncbi:MAG: glucose-6-phosphate dehydrogenase [Armatimonadota bacterium]